MGRWSWGLITSVLDPQGSLFIGGCSELEGSDPTGAQTRT